MARAQEIFAADQRREEERRQLQAAFMDRQIQPDGRARLQKALMDAAERGVNHLQIITFPSELCSDGGRAIKPTRRSRLAQDPGRLRATCVRILPDGTATHGYRLRAEILDFPGGKPGDVGITLSW